jgi:hypothetical protein
VIREIKKIHFLTFFSHKHRARVYSSGKNTTSKMIEKQICRKNRGEKNLSQDKKTQPRDTEKGHFNF